MQSTVIMVIIMVICFFGVRMRLISLYDWNIVCCWSLHSIVEQLKYCACVSVSAQVYVLSGPAISAPFREIIMSLVFINNLIKPCRHITVSSLNRGKMGRTFTLHWKSHGIPGDSSESLLRANAWQKDKVRARVNEKMGGKKDGSGL